MVDVISNRRFQLVNTTKHAVTNAVVCKIAKLAFNHIQPRTTGRCEMLMKSGMPLQPGCDLWVLVRGVIIDNQMQVQVGWCLRVDLFEKLNPLLVPMPWQAVRTNLAFCQFDRGEQRRCAIAFVVMRHRLQTTGEQRETFLRAVQGLNLTLLITRQHQSMRGWIKIQADNVHKLLSELRIIRNLEAFGSMRLQAVIFPDALHQCVIASQGLSQRTCRPLCRVRRRLLCGLANDLCLKSHTLRAMRPPRGASCSIPESRSLENRVRHVPTVRRVQPRSAAIALFS